MEQNNTQNLQEKRKIFGLYARSFFVFILLILSFWFGLEKGKQESYSFSAEKIPLEESILINKEGGKDNAVDFSLFWDVWELLKDKYVDVKDLKTQDLIYGAINGMLSATGDPYTIFLNPEENKQFNEDIEGMFEGIGAELGVREGVLTVIAPLENSPSEKAGLRAGDKIIKIDGEDAVEMTINEAVKKIRGSKGSEVKLTIFRSGETGETKEILIVRDTINVDSVKFEEKENNIFYISVSLFGDSTIREFHSAIRNIPSQTQGLIIDLRNNPGGFLDAAVEMSSRALLKGKIVVIEENSQGKRKELLSTGGDALSKIKTVILINEGSASASEIMAGALRENRDNVTLVGKKSFGKGSVQELVSLSENSAVKITVAKWLTPKGNQINNEGITPDVEVDFTDDDWNNNRDPQLDKAIEILQQS
ncbi:MAG: Carboxyl-terminal protease [Candidatus Moranbacteria bacterium GW2011_GWE2_35_2-]|nr:MAG: Carboxyl-terminal protease [Candidatus Moranbacteria bacterium GW2011_GWE2_35_2-]KKQ06253.1 MAG: Carboxyl-terminal protease [Candidatus Moranbacteria bacterium GW2011_GWF1_36_4]KKQ22839.1 MAG: Carboxyl-terminal protease [Candidatus Moranbacteria bacterium GW2011_GWF2_37_11]KKQ28648.1 MAG: Carboxyl-terminal protease [Candidatus Moranbacteria bacterium GW2011_GWD1_37_17]KKQ30930.1 MAG: Carboxyl-terminal protease [Candidatus Moranbacteria bacterium GW2011_GWE1_37_24]KKQ47209.1 MAG: Carbox